MIFAPKTLSKYIIREFSITLLVVFGIFFSLFLLTGIVEEIVFFKENLSRNLLLKSIFFTLIKLPSKIINFLPFIFLFTGIFFFVKFIRRNEIAPVKLAGLSDYYLVFCTGVYAFIIGFLAVSILSPISSELTKYYESKRQEYSSKNNLVVLTSTGLWLKETSSNSKYIFIRADGIDNNSFSNLANITIYNLDSQWNLIERIDSKKSIIKNYNWELTNSKIINHEQKKSNLNTYNFISTINIDDIRNFFSNPDAYSIWNILSEIDKLRSRGYSPQDFTIRFNKLLSLPFLLFTMIILSTALTINLKNKYNNFTYIFYGVCIGILTHYLTDLSVSIGKTGKVPLALSVWIPIFIIMSISAYNLIKKNEKI